MPGARGAGGVGALSVVLPTFNEEASVLAAVRSVLSAFDQRFGVGEVIVVDDGSRDRTPERVRSLSTEDPRVRIVTHARNEGYGAALCSGVRAARYTHIFFTDADLQFDFREFGRLEAWMGRYDIVVGYRSPRQDPWLRRLNGWGWNRIIRGLFGVGVRDVDCAFKLFRRSVFEVVGLRSVGAFVNSELLVRAASAGFRIKEVPVSHFPRRAGRPTGGQLPVIVRAGLELGGLCRELRSAGAAGDPRANRPPALLPPGLERSPARSERGVACEPLLEGRPEVEGRGMGVLRHPLHQFEHLPPIRGSEPGGGRDSLA